MNKILNTNLLDLKRKYRPVYLNPLFFNFDKRKFPVVRREDVFNSYFDYMKYMPNDNHLVFYMIYLHKTESYLCNDNVIRDLSLVKIGCSKNFINENEKDIYKLLQNMYGNFEVVFILKTENRNIAKEINKKLGKLQLLLQSNEISCSKDLILFDTKLGLGEALIKALMNISMNEHNSVRLKLIAQIFNKYYIEKKNCLF